ncbi:MAG: FixH family protein [Polyangiales bacterium]
MRWLLAVIMLSGCGTSAPDEGFGALETVTSDGGLSIAVRASPSPVVRGVDSFELTVTKADHTVAGLSIDVEPWMAAHGHGTSVKPEVTTLGDGKFLVKNVSLFMPGRWELRTHLTGSSPDQTVIDDHATILVDVP